MKFDDNFTTNEEVGRDRRHRNEQKEPPVVVPTIVPASKLVLPQTSPPRLDPLPLVVSVVHPARPTV